MRGAWHDGRCVVCVTVRTAALAEASAEALVEERLAACVTVLRRVRSIYRWQGEVRADDEVLCLIKTTREASPALSGARGRAAPVRGAGGDRAARSPTGMRRTGLAQRLGA